MFSLGVGCSRDCPPQELKRLVDSTLLEANVNHHAIHSISTLDLKADEPAILDLANDLGIPLRLFTSEELEQEAYRLESPSEIVFKEVGCHGVSEGAALAQVGNDGFLSINKKKTKNATCALAVSNIPSG